MTYDLELHSLAIELNSANLLYGCKQIFPRILFHVSCVLTYEVDTDGRDVALGVGVVGEPKEQAGLSDTGVTDEQKLEQVVVSVMVRISYHIFLRIVNLLQRASRQQQ